MVGFGEVLKSEPYRDTFSLEGASDQDTLEDECAESPH